MKVQIDEFYNEQLPEISILLQAKRDQEEAFDSIMLMIRNISIFVEILDGKYATFPDQETFEVFRDAVGAEYEDSGSIQARITICFKSFEDREEFSDFLEFMDTST